MRLSYFRLLLLCLLALLLPGRPSGAQSGTCPQVEPYLSIAAVSGVATSGSLGQPDQATVPVGGCAALRFVVVRQSGATTTTADVTNDPNSHYFTSPAQGSFSTKNVFCAAAGDCNQDITIYGVYHDPCTETDQTDTVIIHVSPCGMTLQCPSDIVQPADPGKCSARVQYPTPRVTGNIGPVVFACTPPSGTDFPVGATTVTCKGTDAVGNSATCTFTITVRDTEPPQIRCPADLAAMTDAGHCSADLAVSPAMATDNCPGVTVAGKRGDSKPLTDPYPVGTTTITWTATDAAGNSVVCTQSVTVADGERPQIQCPADIIRNTDPGKCSAVVTFAVGATDNCGTAAVVCTPPSGATFPKGTTRVTCTATDAGGRQTTCSFNVTVKDAEPPICHAPANIVQSADAGQCTAVVSYTATATDNCDTPTVVCTPPPGSAFPLGTTTVTCTAMDSSGNSATCSFQVTVKDTELPRIQCPPDIDAQPSPGQCGAVVNFPAPTASDNCPGVTVTCDHLSGSLFPVGTTTVHCTATDKAGNTASCSFNVTVRIPFACPADVTVTADAGQSSTGVALSPPRTSCSGLTVTSERSDGKPLTDPFSVGTTTITWVATDASGHTALCNQQITVIAATTNTIEGTVTQHLNGVITPLVGATVLLSRLATDGSVFETQTATTDPNAGGLYRFTGLPAGVYRLEKRPSSPADQAFPGNNAVAINGHTIQITTVPGVTLYTNNNFAEILTTPATSGPLLQVTDPVAHPTGIEFFGANPPPPEGEDFTSVRGATNDGSLLLVDWAGTALIRLPQPAGTPGVSLLDPDLPAPPDGVGIARLLRVEVNPSGTAAIFALRADNTRGVYRLQNDTLTRLGLLDGSRGGRELAIGNTGQIAYVANADPNDLSSPLALFQSTGGPGVELLRQGQPVVNGATIVSFSSLTGNASGDLAVLVTLSLPDGATGQAILRKRGTAPFELLAVTGQSVQQGGGTGVLTQLRSPRIGPEGSVVFLGAGADFVNFFVARPGRPLAALLPASGADLTLLDDTTRPRFDYEVAADGTIGLEAALANPNDSTLWLISPTGFITPVVGGRQDLEPILRPVFGSGGRVFFLAENQQLPTDRNGRFPVGLYRYRPDTGALEPVAQPQQPIPGWQDAQLLSVTQRPVVVGDDLVFGVVFGGHENLPVPTPALFRVPQTGALVEGLTAPEGLVAQEGFPEQDASRVSMIRDLSFIPGGPLVAYGLMPGAGPLIAPPPGPAAATSGFSIQSVALATPVINPLVAQGDNLGPGQLQNVLPPLLAVAPDRELFAARTSPSQTAPRLPDNEGLFTVNPSKLIGQIAVTRQATAGLPGALYNGFADTKLFILGPPSVGANGRVVFKALLDQSNSALAGIFQWTAGAAPVLIRGPEAPAALLRWAAAPSGVAYVLEKPAGGAAQLLGGTGGALKPLITAGSTAVPGVGVLTDLTDMVLNSAGDLFVVGTTASGAGIFRLAGGQLTAIARQGAAVSADRTDTGFSFAFAGGFMLAPDSARGDLIFRAVVQKPGDKPREGEFQFSQGAVVTREIATVDVASARTLSVDALGSQLPSQSRNGVSISANFQNGSWSLVRFQLRSNGTLTPPVTIAQDMKGKLANVPRFAALDTGALLEQESDLVLRSGPVFTVDDAGNVAYMASDGKAWGVYSTPGHG